MMIAHDFLQWKWNFLGCSKDIRFKSIECKHHKLFGISTSLLRSALKNFEYASCLSFSISFWVDLDVELKRYRRLKI